MIAKQMREPELIQNTIWGFGQMTHTLTAREVQESDFEATAQFLAQVFGADESQWQYFFDHWWRANPAWDESIPRGWLVQSAEKKVIAFTANIPFRYVINGKLGLCCATGPTAA